MAFTGAAVVLTCLAMLGATGSLPKALAGAQNAVRTLTGAEAGGVRVEGTLKTRAAVEVAFRG